MVNISAILSQSALSFKNDPESSLYPGKFRFEAF